MFGRVVSAYQRIDERRKLYGLEGALAIRAVEKSQQRGNREETPLVPIRPPGTRKRLWMRLGTSDPWVAKQVFISEEYEPLKHLRDVHTIIDCGANVGYTSAYFLDHHPQAKVLAVEAATENIELCRRNLQAYGERAAVVHAAVWDSPGKLQVFCPQRSREKMAYAWRVRDAEAAAPEADDGPVDSGVPVEYISSVTVNDLIDQAGGFADILKIDIEGAEAQVFAGDTSWLDRVRALAIEIHWGNCDQVVKKAFEGKPFQTSASGELTMFWNSAYAG